MLGGQAALVDLRAAVDDRIAEHQHAPLAGSALFRLEIFGAHAEAVDHIAMAEALHPLVGLEQILDVRIGLVQRRIAQPKAGARQHLGGDDGDQPEDSRRQDPALASPHSSLPCDTGTGRVYGPELA
ncbi:hypothetical protein IC580_11145 [Cupriavidus sp. ISTL7]|nr:hypothetical protein IC580_11145 [Cupriavidus sp. ISTL7]